MKNEEERHSHPGCFFILHSAFVEQNPPSEMCATPERNGSSTAGTFPERGFLFHGLPAPRPRVEGPGHFVRPVRDEQNFGPNGIKAAGKDHLGLPHLNSSGARECSQPK
jgi:hypothetical protein